MEEHLWKDQEATQHQTVEHNSEGVFAPQNSQGEYTDNVGYGSFQKGLAVGSFDVYQTFSVSYKGAAVNLSTEFEHETGVMGLDIFNHVAVIKP